MCFECCRARSHGQSRQKHRRNVPVVEVLGHILRNHCFVGFQQIEIAPAHLRGDFEAHVQQLAQAAVVGRRLLCTCRKRRGVLLRGPAAHLVRPRAASPDRCRSPWHTARKVLRDAPAPRHRFPWPAPALRRRLRPGRSALRATWCPRSSGARPRRTASWLRESRDRWRTCRCPSAR